MAIRLVLFDALHTLVTPRAPIFIQYANVFEPHLGKLNPDAIKSSFKIGKTQKFHLALSIVRFLIRLVSPGMSDRTREALKQVQVERPAYASGAPEWWGEVIQRTALGAGADPSRKCPPLDLSMSD